MSVKQLGTPCWEPCAPGELPGSDGPHWDRREVAAKYADPGDTVLPFPIPCYAVICDGNSGDPCGETMEDEEEGWIIHLEDPADAPDQAKANGWEVTPDGTVRCWQCIEEASEGTRR